MKTLGFVFGYARRYIKQLVLAMVGMTGLVGVELLGPQIIRRLIAMVSEGVWSAVTQREILTLALVILGLYIVRAGLRFLSNYSSHVAGWAVVADSRRRIYEHLQRLSLRFYEDKQVGELMSRTINDSEQFERLIAHAIPDTIVNVLMLFGVMAVMVSMNWQLMLLTVIPVPLIVFAMKGFGKYVRPAFRERQKDLAELNASLNDNLTGIREIKTFTREPIEYGRISDRINRYRDSMLHALRLMAIFGPFVEFTSSLGTIIVIYFGGRLAFQQVLPIEDLVAFFLYLNMFYQPVRTLSNVWENIQEALASAERVSELLEEEPEIDEARDAIVLPEPVRGEIELAKVSFHYRRGDMVLEDVNLKIPATSVVALVGPTGVGKTTLASLIPRLYDVSAGRLTVDGHDVRELKLKNLRRQIAMVLQDVFLFHGSVRDNILFGRPEATEEEVIEAAKVANAHDFIMSLPQGYATMVGERGMKLSGGQKQRVSIARAVLKNAPILILDEATSSVDTETELLIQQAMERLMEGRTTLIIAHRLSTVRNADLIVVLADTGIAEMGTHEQLMSHAGLYRHLWEIQSRVIHTRPEMDELGQPIEAFGQN
ncbi:MAG: ABC transporter ATP-binding protein [Anaerolineae bacterium]|nr:ABC transporter ATP-binding protein [Anaerolineae bacterium]